MPVGLIAGSPAARQDGWCVKIPHTSAESHEGMGLNERGSKRLQKCTEGIC